MPLAPALKRSYAVAHGLAGNRNGGVAIAFAIVLPVLVGFVGLGVDYSRISDVQSRLQSLVDSAALDAVQRDTLSDAEGAFNSYISAHADTVAVNSPLSARVDSFDGVTLKVSVDTSLSTPFAGFFGLKQAPIRSSAVAKKASYQELYFAIDLSSSLGMAATPADRTALENLTQPYVSSFYGTKIPQGCAFACHRREGWEPGTQTVYDMARAAGIKLREDELKVQFAGLVDLLLDPTDSTVQAGMRKIGVVGFSNYAMELIAPSDAADPVKASLDAFPYVDHYETSYANLFSELTNIVGPQGQGSQSSPRKTIILITDGIESRDAFYAQSAIDLSLCTDIKQQGIRLAVVEIKYPTLTSNEIYDDTVLPVETAISPAMSSCASPGWYFQADTNEDVPAKFVELKTRVGAASVHLSK